MQYWGSLKRYTSTLAALDTLINRRITLLNPSSWADRNDRELMSLYASTTSGRVAFAYCMAEGNETAHHWQVYADRGFGVCIAFDKARLVEALSRDPAITYGSVSYVSWRDLKLRRPYHDLPFIKRQVYRAEREFRLIAVPDAKYDKPSYDLDIPINCITSIAVSGEVPVVHFEAFKRLARSLPECGKLSIRHSGLLRNSRWAAAVDAALMDHTGDDTAADQC